MPAPKSSSVASFVPSSPIRVLVLAHGYPWPDDSRSDDELAEYARAAVRRWQPFASAHRAIVIAPAFGGSEFAGYREMRGQQINPDELVNALADEAGERMPGFSGTFSLHGHSAGAQFAARYLVAHPERLDVVVLSAPSTYPLPDPAIPWPNGMGASVSTDLGAPSEPGGASRATASLLAPSPAGWLAATSDVAVTVLVGSLDTQRRPRVPGQLGSTRIERAVAWVDSMRRHAEASGRNPTIELVLAPGLAHDEEALTGPAQEILADRWRRSQP